LYSLRSLVFVFAKMKLDCGSNSRLGRTVRPGFAAGESARRLGGA